MSKQSNNKCSTSYKEFSKQKLKKIKNRTVLPIINSTMSYIERMAMGVMEWEGVDGNGIALSRKVEEYLFYMKKCAIVDTNEVGLAVVKLTPLGVNINGEPAGYDILTQNGVKLTPKYPRIAPNAVGQIGYDNAIILTDSQLWGRGRIDGVWNWVEKYADAQITADQQMINQRAPLIGLTKKPGQEQFARVAMIDIATGLNGLIIDEEMGESIKALNLESQFNIEKINSMQHEYLARALNSLGIDSLQAFGKKERMIVDEVESNDEALAMILSDCLMARTKPLINNKTAEEYGITCRIAKPYRVSTHRENLIDYEPTTLPAGKDNSDVIGKTVDEVMG